MNIFGNYFDAPIKVQSNGEVSASQIPDIKNPDAQYTLIYNSVGQDHHAKAYDILFCTDAVQDIMVIVAAFIEKHSLQCMMVEVCVGTYLMRFYKDADWPCVEHPEMLLGAPIGMYHCPYCGEMQVAGTYHIPKGDI